MPTLDSLASQLAATGPSCGATRLIAVDGYAGSGKTTFAARLAARLAAALGDALGDAPVVHLDDLATHEQFFDWTERLLDEVVTPLAERRAVRHRVYDWNTAHFDSVREIAAAPPFLILEGVGAGRRAIRPWLAALLWMDVDAESARARGERRDGPELAEFWARWIGEQSAHFRADPSRPFADFLVSGTTGELFAHAA
ncbi:uridine kinase [Streptacidiphilus sp. MAP12-20]|uniref:uridine kinase family protein n=1 Tax=Streptacidiphilus sp. MAP12-20 TaxID=3156299 RepID=UPI0035130231